MAKKRRTPTHPLYQLLPPLSPEEFDALKADIQRRGVQVPVDKDERGNVLDGHHRDRACTELGITNYPVRVISGLTEEQKRHHVLSVNLNRRHLNAQQKRQLVIEELRRSPDCSDRLLGNLIGVDHKTVGVVRRRLIATGEIPQCQHLRGEDGRECRVRSILAQNAGETRRAEAALRTLGDDAPRKAIPLLWAESLAKRKRWAVAADRQKPTAIDGIELVHSDFRKLKVRPASVHLIVTDPPYHREYLPLWNELGAWARRVLTPGGLLLAYSGIADLPEVLNRLGRHLAYHWTVALYRAGQHSMHYQRHVANGWRPVLVFAKGRPKPPHHFLKDVFDSTGKQKDHHEWQQDVAEAVYFIELLSRPGELVVDPFGGSFTTAVACYRLGRRFVGCDIDPGCVARGHARLEAEMGGKGRK